MYTVLLLEAGLEMRSMLSKLSPITWLSDCSEFANQLVLPILSFLGVVTIRFSAQLLADVLRCRCFVPHTALNVDILYFVTIAYSRLIASHSPILWSVAKGPVRTCVLSV